MGKWAWFDWPEGWISDLSFQRRTRYRSTNILIYNFFVINVSNCLCQKTPIKWLFGFRSSCHMRHAQLPTRVPTHTVEALHCLVLFWASSRKAVNVNFYNLWFDPTGNQTRVYRFCSRRSIHSTTDRLNNQVKVKNLPKVKQRTDVLGLADT